MTDNKWAEELALKVYRNVKIHNQYPRLEHIIEALLEAERRGYRRGVDDSALAITDSKIICATRSDLRNEILKLKED